MCNNPILMYETTKSAVKKAKNGKRQKPEKNFLISSIEKTAEKRKKARSFPGLWKKDRLGCSPSGGQKSYKILKIFFFKNMDHFQGSSLWNLVMDDP